MRRLPDTLVSLMTAALIVAPWLTTVSASDLKASHRPVTNRSAQLCPQPLFSDFDGDTLPDVAEFSSTGQYKNIRLSLSGSGASSLTFDSGSPEPGRLVSGDIDHDSDQDLVWYSQTSPRVVFFWINDGKGSFGPATRYQQSDQRPDLDLNSLLNQIDEPHLSDQQPNDGSPCALRTADSPVIELAARREVIASTTPLTSHSDTHRVLSPCLKIVRKRGPPAHLS